MTTSDQVSISSTGEIRPAKPCCHRIDYGEGFCLLRDGHEGMHVGKPNVEPVECNEFGPEQAAARRWR